MNYHEIIEKILTHVQTQIHSKDFKETYFPKTDGAFTRKRKMTLDKVIAFLMQRSLQSLDIKIDDWLETNGLSEETMVSRQAISKTRQQITPDIFRGFQQDLVRIFLENAGNKRKSWNGYQVYAIDGTDVQIPTTNETLSDFGVVKTRFHKQWAGASATAVFDVMNDLVLDCVLCPFRTAEREMAEQVINSVLHMTGEEKAIFVFDRGYPSYKFLEYLTEKKLTYVIRIKKEMSRLRDPNQKDGVVYRKCGRKCREIRTIQLELENGTEEYLITNLPKSEIVLEQFRELYFLRWGIEGKYKELKGTLEIEAFSGKKSICTRQDFYITIFLSNIVAMIKQETDEEIKKEPAVEKEYQARRSYLLHQVNKIISRILMKKLEIAKEIQRIIGKGKKKRSQIRRNRKSERNLNINRRKYSMNHKSCL